MKDYFIIILHNQYELLKKSLINDYGYTKEKAERIVNKKLKKEINYFLNLDSKRQLEILKDRLLNLSKHLDCKNERNNS